MQHPDTPDGLFHDGNPLTGQKGTPITAGWLNALMTITVFFHGANEPPAADLGDDGDLYLCPATRNFYGPKADGAWGPSWGQGLPGPQGGQGPAGSALAAFWADVQTISISEPLTGYDCIYLGNTTGNLNCTLPVAAGKKGRVIYLENIGTTGYIFTLAAVGAETVNGAATLELDCGMGLTIFSDGANWRVKKG